MIKTEINNIQNEKHTIITEIIQVLEKHNLTISEANDILYLTTKKLRQQPVKSSYKEDLKQVKNDKGFSDLIKRITLQKYQISN